MITLPKFLSLNRFPRSRQDATSAASRDDRSLTYQSDGGIEPDQICSDLTEAQIKRATRTRKFFALFTSFCFFISVVFLIMLEIGNTYNCFILSDLYFIKFDLTKFRPKSIPHGHVENNTLAQTVGLHEYYQVGLWGHCSSFAGKGIAACTKPKAMYWLNPVELLTNDLLQGAEIEFPSNIHKVLPSVEMASAWMFVLFLTSAILSGIMMCITPLSVYSRWIALPVTYLTAMTALFLTVATVLATSLFVVVRRVINSSPALHVQVSLGYPMFAMMWVATAFAILAAFIQGGLCCFGVSRRNFRIGRKKENRKA